jgi:hypothetical protein
VRTQREDQRQADGAAYPWAQDLDGVWHKRPADDTWNPDFAGTQCRTLCGRAIASVRASQFNPDERGLDEDESVCRCAFGEGA